MRLATVNVSGTPRVGVVEGELIRLLPVQEGDMVTLIGRGKAEIERLVKASPLDTIPLADAKLMAPIQRFSRDVLCTGWNYWDHFEESRGKREGQDVDKPKAPTFFTKGPNTVIGPCDEIGLDPHISAKWDYEAEVGIVIGKRCRSVSKAEALDIMRKEQPEMVKSLISNPLPNSFTVSPVKGEYTKAIARPARRGGTMRVAYADATEKNSACATPPTTRPAHTTANDGAIATITPVSPPMTNTARLPDA